MPLATLRVEKQNANQTVEYLDGGGEPLADAALADGSLSADGLLDTRQQVALGVGTTTVKVKVTAPGRSAATTYTFAILRHALCSAASAENRIWTGNLAVGEGQGVRGLLAGTYGGLDDTDFAYRGTARSIGLLAEGDDGSLAARIDGGAPADLAGLVLHVDGRQYALADATRDGATFTWTGNAPGWAGGDAACLALTAPPDTTPPALLRAEVGAESSGRDLTLTFDEALDPDGSTKREPSAFTVTVEGSPRAVDDVTLIPDDDGHFYVVRLEFSDSNAVRHGERVTVAYAPPTGDGARPLKDRAGNEAAGFDATAVANRLEAPPAVAVDPSSFPVAVANYGGDSDNTENLNGGGQKAQAFTTGSNPSGYYLRAVTFLVIRRNSNNLRAALHAASGSNPGAKLAALRNPASLVVGENTFTAPAGGVHLAAGTTYFLLFTQISGQIGQQYTSSDAEDSGGLDGWSIANQGRERSSSTGNWAGTIKSPGHVPSVLKIRVRASALPGAGAESALVSNLGRGVDYRQGHFPTCPGLHDRPERRGLRPDRSPGEVHFGRPAFQERPQRYREGRAGRQHRGGAERAGHDCDYHYLRGARELEAGAEYDLLGDR